MQPSPLSSSRTFSSFQKEARFLLSGHSPSTPPANNWHAFSPCGFACSDISSERIIQYVACGVWLISLRTTCLQCVPDVWSEGQSFPPFHGCVIFHCTYGPLLCVHSSAGGCSGRFLLLATVSSAAVSIHVWVFVWVDVFISLGYVPSRSRTAESCGTPYSTY